MLPPFDEFGYLPQGIHACNLGELVARFGTGSPEREVETQELIDFVQWATRAGIRRIVVNGCYVTARVAPNDIDVVVLPGMDYPSGESAFSQQETRWPFLQVVFAIDETDLNEWCMKDFGTDRNRLPKGVVEVLL